MLDPKKVHMMANLASYENNQGKRDFKLYHYRRSVYLSKKALETFFLISIAYICGAFLYMMNYYSDIITYGFTFAFKEKLEPVAIGYVIVVGLTMIISGYRDRKKYDAMLIRINSYDKRLLRLQQYDNQAHKEGKLG